MNRDLKTLSLFTITWPIFIELLLHMLMGNIDTLMLSQYSDNSVAAVGVSNQIISIVIVMFNIVAQGAVVLISQNLGANLQQEAARISVMSISLNLWFSLVLSAGLSFGAVPILKLMDMPAEIIGEATTYMQIVGGFIFLQALLSTIGGILRSYGYTKDTMTVTIGINIINAFGNFLVIFGPFGFPILGVKGVAYVAAISRLLGVIMLVILLLKRVKGLNIKDFFIYQIDHLKALLQIGVPSAGEQLSYNTSQIMLTYFMGQMGTIAITTNVYTKNVMMFIFVFAMAIAQGTQILIGHMVGAGKIKEAYDRAIKSLKLSAAIAIGMASIMFLISEQFLSIFTDNPSIIKTGSLLLLLTIILDPGRSFNMVMISSLRAAGDVKFPVYVGIIVMWGIGVTTAWFFGIYLGLGLIGIWIGLIADEWVRGLFMLRRWQKKHWVRMTFVKQKT